MYERDRPYIENEPVTVRYLYLNYIEKKLGYVIFDSSRNSGSFGSERAPCTVVCARNSKPGEGPKGEYVNTSGGEGEQNMPVLLYFRENTKILFFPGTPEPWSPKCLMLSGEPPCPCVRLLFVGYLLYSCCVVSQRYLLCAACQWAIMLPVCHLESPLLNCRQKAWIRPRSKTVKEHFKCVPLKYNSQERRRTICVCSIGEKSTRRGHVGARCAAPLQYQFFLTRLFDALHVICLSFF